MFGTIKRFAMNPKVLNYLRPALSDASGKITAGSVAGRFAPDAIFGVMAAAQTPGDGFDRGTAFLTSTLGGGGGGAAVTALTRGKLGAVGELVGGMGGDMLGMQAGDMISRGKDKLMGGKGQTAWERMGDEQQAQYAAELEQQILRQYGLLQGTREQYAQADPNLMVRYADSSTGMGVA